MFRSRPWWPPVFDDLQAHVRGPRLAGAVLAVAVDNHSAVEQVLGRAEGDRLLAEVFRRVRDVAVAYGAVVRRLREPGFLVIAPRMPHDEIVDLAQVVSRFGWREVVNGAGAIASPISVGVASVPHGGDDTETLTRNARLALSRARAERAGTIMFFDERMRDQVRADLAVGAALRRAIEEKTISIEFQPQIDLAGGGGVVGAEVLARWHDPVLGPVSPGRFIPLAEQIGMSELLDWVVFEKVCRQMRDWDRAGIEVPRISVNCSPVTLTSPTLVWGASRIAEGFDVDPSRLTVEVIESHLVDGSTGVQNLNALRDLGFRISLDDFGTGYCSFGQLATLPVDELKVDRSFVCVEEIGDAVSEVASAILRVASAFDVDVVAEGIETAEQRDFLAYQGCRVGQGYLFSKSLPADEFVSWTEHFTQAARVPGPAGGHVLTLAGELDQLRRLHERIELVGRVAKVGTWELDLDTMLFHSSAPYLELNGRPADEHTLPWEEVLAALEPDARRRVLAFMASDEEETMFDYRLVGDQGEVRVVEAAARKVPGPSGSRGRIVGAGWDVTKERTLVEELRRLAAR